MKKYTNTLLFPLYSPRYKADANRLQEEVSEIKAALAEYVPRLSIDIILHN